MLWRCLFLSMCRQHPNIVQTFTYIIKPCSTSVAQAGSDEEVFVDRRRVLQAPDNCMMLNDAGGAVVTTQEPDCQALEHCMWACLGRLIAAVSLC